MRRYGALPFLALFAIPALSNADIIKPGSSFNVDLLENDQISTVSFVNALLTSGGSTSFTFNGAHVTASESEATLPGGVDQILVTFTASGDMFPQLAAGNTYGGFTGAGNVTAMQLTTDFNLTSAVLTYASPSGPYTSADFIAFLNNPSHWNGEFLQNHFLGGFVPVGGLDTTSITLDLRGMPAPEPSSFALLGTGLFCLAGAVRKRFA